MHAQKWWLCAEWGATETKRFPLACPNIAVHALTRCLFTMSSVFVIRSIRTSLSGTTHMNCQITTILNRKLLSNCKIQFWWLLQHMNLKWSISTSKLWLITSVLTFALHFCFISKSLLQRAPCMCSSPCYKFFWNSTTVVVQIIIEATNENFVFSWILRLTLSSPEERLQVVFMISWFCTWYLPTIAIVRNILEC